MAERVNLSAPPRLFHGMMNAVRARGRTVAAVAAGMVLAAACTIAGPSRASFRPQLAWEPCPSDVEIQFLSRHRCGWLTVLQDRSKPKGKTIRLLVVETWPVGVAPLPGRGFGFGTNLGDGYSHGSAPAGATRVRRINVALELRGTGHSQPSLACPEANALDGREAGRLSGHASLLGEFLSAVQACRDRLQGEGVDPARYDLEGVARDTEDLRVALGVDRWAYLNSYGTRSRYLFEYLRAFPGRAAAAYLDSPQFPQVDEVTAGVKATRQVLDQLFTACAADKACAEAYPDLATLWGRVVHRLKRQPLHDSVTVDAATLLRASRFALGGDGPEQAGLNLTLLPATIAAAATGRISGPLAAALEDSPLYCAGYRPLCVGVGGQGFSLGAYLTVLCRDRAPFIDWAALSTAVGDDPAFRGLVDDHPYLAACKVWGVAPADPVVARPVHTEVPLLMLIGQFDSYSSAREARQVAATLPRAWVVEVPAKPTTRSGSATAPSASATPGSETLCRRPRTPPAWTSCGCRSQPRLEQGGSHATPAHGGSWCRAAGRMRHGSAPRDVVFVPHDIVSLPGGPDHPGGCLSDPRPHLERPGRCHQGSRYSTNDAASVRPIFAFRKNVVFTIKLQGGQWTEFESDDGGPDQVGDLGTYTVTSDVLAMTGDGGKGHQRLKWTLDGIALSLETLPGDPQEDAAAPVAIFTSGPFYREG